MKEFMLSLREFSFLTSTLRLVLAVICGGAIGFGRERQGRAAGLRTHVLVCLGSALTVLIGCFAVDMLHLNTDPLRIAAQVVSGIGFLGVGTILVTGKFHVTGLTTAAGLWATAAIGLAAGIGFYEGAVVCTLLAILMTLLLSKLESRMTKHPRKLLLYIELRSVENLPEFQKTVNKQYDVGTFSVTPPRSGTAGNVGVELTLLTHKDLLVQEVVDELQADHNVCFTMESR